MKSGSTAQPAPCRIRWGVLTSTIACEKKRRRSHPQTNDFVVVWVPPRCPNPPQNWVIWVRPNAQIPPQIGPPRPVWGPARSEPRAISTPWSAQGAGTESTARGDGQRDSSISFCAWQCCVPQDGLRRNADLHQPYSKTLKRESPNFPSIARGMTMEGAASSPRVQQLFFTTVPGQPQF